MFVLSVYPRLLSVILYVSLIYLYQTVVLDVNHGLCEYLSARNSSKLQQNEVVQKHHLGSGIQQPCSGISLSLTPEVTVNQAFNLHHGTCSPMYTCCSTDISDNGVNTSKTTRLCYSRDKLLELNCKSILPKQTFDRVKSFGISRHVRARRGGRHIRRRIPVIYNNRQPPSLTSFTNDYDELTPLPRPSSLVNIPTTNDTSNVSVAARQEHAGLPSIYLTNAQSLVNKA